MAWVLWPAGAVFVTIFILACCDQTKLWVQLAEIAIGLLMLTFAVKGGWALFAAAWGKSPDEAHVGSALFAWIYGTITFYLLTPWMRENYG